MATQSTEWRGDSAAVAQRDETGGEESGFLATIKRFHARQRSTNATYALAADIVKEIKEDQPSMLAKQAAYSLLYAIPSVLIVVISIAALVDMNTGSEVSGTLQRFINQQAPADLRPLLGELVQYALVETSKNAAVFAAIVSLGIAIWSASGGVGALMFAINEVYDILDSRSFIKKTVLKLGLMLLGGISVVASLLLLAFGRLLLTWLPGDLVQNSPLGDFLHASPLWALGLLFISLMLLYWFSLDTPKSPRWLVPGAAFATIATGVLMRLLDLILGYTNPGAAYGVTGSVLILLWTLFMLSVIVVVGAIVNSVLGRRYDRKLIAALQSRPLDMPSGRRIATSVYR